MKNFILLIILAVGMQQAMAQATRKVLLEEYTGAWCGFCPYGMTVIEGINASDADVVITIAHHGPSGQDVMNTTYGQGLITAYGVGSYPSASIDRSDVGGYVIDDTTSHWQTNAEIRAYNMPTPVGIDISTTYNATTRAASITVTANFVGGATGDMRINCLLVEDSVSTATSSYYQHNYMGRASCGASDPYSEWYNYPCTIQPATSGQYIFTHRNVERTNLSPTWGTTGIIPSSVNAGQNFSTTYTTTVNAAWNINHLKVVAFISNYSANIMQRDILNVEKVALGNTVTAVKENPSAIDKVSLESAFPNPFNQLTNIRVNVPATQHISIKIYDLLGHEVITLADETLSPGRHNFTWNGRSKDGATLANGVYLVRLQSDKQSFAKSIVLARN